MGLLYFPPTYDAFPPLVRPSPVISLRGNGRQPDKSHFLRPPNPKDPSVLKIVRRANSLRGEKNATAIAKRYGECSEVLVFLGKRGRKTVRIVKTTAVAKYYGFGRRTIFSTEGSFGKVFLEGALYRTFPRKNRMITRERGNRVLVVVLWPRQFSRLRNALNSNIVFLRPFKLVLD